MIPLKTRGLILAVFTHAKSLMCFGQQHPSLGAIEWVFDLFTVGVGFQLLAHAETTTE